MELALVTTTLLLLAGWEHNKSVTWNSTSLSAVFHRLENWKFHTTDIFTLLKCHRFHRSFWGGVGKKRCRKGGDKMKAASYESEKINEEE